jgi:hypothetical protein
MGAVLTRIFQWISLALHRLFAPPLATSLDVKSKGEGVSIYHASNQVVGNGRCEQYTTMLRISDSRPARFVLCLELYISFETGTPAHHCEIQFTGILIRKNDALLMKSAHVSLSNALDESYAKRFIEYPYELRAEHSLDSIKVDVNSIKQIPELPSWLSSQHVPGDLRLHQ